MSFRRLLKQRRRERLLVPHSLHVLLVETGRSRREREIRGFRVFSTRKSHEHLDILRSTTGRVRETLVGGRGEVETECIYTVRKLSSSLSSSTAACSTAPTSTVRSFVEIERQDLLSYLPLLGLPLPAFSEIEQESTASRHTQPVSSTSYNRLSSIVVCFGGVSTDPLLCPDWTNAKYLEAVGADKEHTRNVSKQRRIVTKTETEDHGSGCHLNRCQASHADDVQREKKHKDRRERLSCPCLSSSL